MGTLPRYLAGRDAELKRFVRILEGYPEKRRNLRITGLRGVGKTVLLKQYEKLAKEAGWTVVRRDLSPRSNDEAEMALAMQDYLREAADGLSLTAKVKNLVTDAAAAIGELEIQLEGVKVGLGKGRPQTTALESRIYKALVGVGRLASKNGTGFALMLDEAHTVADRPKNKQWPLYGLVAAFVRAQDQEDPRLPIMLVTCGLPPLVEQLQAARSHSERLFRGEVIDNLPVEPERNDEHSEAAAALIRPAEGGPISFDPQTAQQIAEDVDGYPFFLQFYGEALWEAARDGGLTAIDAQLYATTRSAIRRALDQEFFENRYRDVRASDQMTLRVAASMGGESFKVSDLNSNLTSRNANANAQSLNRLVTDNVLFRDKQGIYAYTAPLFGDFLRRRHPRQPGDG